MANSPSDSSRRRFLQVSVGASAAVGTGGVLGLAAGATSVPGATAPTVSHPSPRLIYNDDGDSVVTIPHRVPMALEHLTDLVNQFAGTHVGRYVFCLGNGRVASHKSEVADQYWAVNGGKYDQHTRYRVGENARQLIQQGNDPPAALGKRARELGLEFYLSLRLNDAHFAYSTDGPAKAHTAGSFWHRYPQYRLEGNGQHYSRHLFDYSHAAVRDFRLAYIEEVCRNYSIDGFELDFMRHPFYFPASVASERAPVMTEFVRNVRQRLDAIGKEKGMPIPLQVLVPRTLAAGLQVGLDVASWVREGLVQAIVPKHFIQFNMEVPVDEFQKITQGTSVQLYPCIEQRGESGPRLEWLVFPDEKFRAAAAHYWNANVDGIYLYNFFNHRPHPLCQEDRRLLQEIGSPDSLKLRDKHYFLMAAETEVRRHFLMTATTDLAGERRQVPQPLDTRPEGHVFIVNIGDNLAEAHQQGMLKRVLMKLEVPGILPEGDRWEVQLNGRVIPEDQQTCVADAVTFSERYIDIDLTNGPHPIPGANEIRVILKQRHPAVGNMPQLTNVETIVEYR